MAGKKTPSDSKVTKITDGIPRNIKTFTDYKMRGNLMRSFNKFKKTQKGRVAYMGGSVTMRPWRNGLEAWLKKQFPDTEFDFIMAGIGGTPADLGTFRVPGDVFKNGPVDLFFLEFAVNGGGVKEMEGIVRQAKELNPEIDIVMMYFANRSHMGEFNKGKVPQIVKEHEKVAKVYDIPALYLYREIAQRVKDGRIAWNNFARDSVHPDAEGSDMYAACIIDFLEEAWKNPKLKAEKPRKLPRKLAKDCLDKGRYVPFDDYKKVKGFKLEKAWKHKDRVINIVLPTPVWVGDKADSEITVDFEGNAVGLYYMSCKDSGIIEYSLDKGKYQELDTFNDRKNMPRFKIISDKLKKGKHSLTIRISDKNNQKSSGNSICLLQFLVN